MLPVLVIPSTIDIDHTIHHTPYTIHHTQSFIDSLHNTLLRSLHKAKQISGYQQSNSMMVSGRCCTRQRISKVLKNSSKIVLLLSLSGFILLNLQQIPLASVRISDYQTQSFPSPQQPRICLAREKYKEWINALFELAPPAPNCSDVESFISDYNETSPYWVHGTLVLQRNENVTGTDNATRTRTYHDAYEFVHSETRKPASGGGEKDFLPEYGRMPINTANCRQI